MEGADMEMDSPTVTLTDEAGRSLTCYLEGSLEVEGQKYGLLYPVDSPVQIFAWEMDEAEGEEILKDVEEAEIDEVFATAQAVLAEQNLKLKRTALSLTVEGDLPEVVEDEILTLEIEEGEETTSEEFQFLTSFYQKEQEYAVYTPLDPLLLIARMDAHNHPELLSPEEFQKIQPILEEQLFEELDELE
jgi:hypothetical protein